MKRKSNLLIVIMLMALCICLPAYAEEAAEAPAVLLDVTDVIIAVVLAAGGYVWRKWIHPWLERKQLADEAEIVVNAVEALMGRGNGAEKWKLAVDKIQQYGFDVNFDIVMDALRAAWRKLNTEQVQAGEKEKPPEKA